MLIVHLIYDHIHVSRGSSSVLNTVLVRKWVWLILTACAKYFFRTFECDVFYNNKLGIRSSAEGTSSTVNIIPMSTI